MATISSKLLVQLPALLFSVFVLVTGRQAWSNDHITTYKFTPKNGEPSRMVIRERIIDGVHLYLSRIQPDAEVREGTHQSVTGVMALFPDPDHSGRYIMRSLLPSVEAIPENFSFTGAPGTETSYAMIIPSQRDLNQLLLSSPAREGDGFFVALALPFPRVHIPVQWGGASQVMELRGSILNPDVAASENNTVFTVTGSSWGLRRARMDHISGKSEEIGARAELSHNEGDGRVQLQRFEIVGYLTIEREGSEEGGEPDEIFNEYWEHLKEYFHEIAKEKYRKKKEREFYQRLRESGRDVSPDMWDARIGRDEGDRERLEALRREYDAFMNSADEAYIEPESITAGGEPGNSTADGELEDGAADRKFDSTLFLPEVSS